MGSPNTLPPIMRRRHNGQKILPVIIYAQAPSKTQRWLPMLIVCTCGVWIFALGALIERLPDGQSMLFTTTTTTTMSSLSDLEDRGLAEASTAAAAALESDGRGSDSLSFSNTLIPATKDEPRLETPALQGDTNNDLHHQHQIPNVLIFTHSINLLTYNPQNNLPANSTSEAMAEQEELVALKKNIQHTIDMNPHSRVRFLTDQDCIRSLQAVFGPNAPLIKYFQLETKGMYKADICRGAALWETGGIYLDVDVGARMPFFDVLQPNTTFATAMVHKDSNHIGNFFQAFMASTPQHAILKRYLHLFLEHYQGTLAHPIKRGPLGVILLRRAFDDVVLKASGEVMAMDLQKAEGMKDKDKAFLLGPKLLDTATYGRIQLWQEIKYHPKYFSNVIPAPTWGTRRACHFVVVANKKFPLTVPLYSRIAGSRMCSEKKTVDKKNSTSDSPENNEKELHTETDHDSVVIANTH